MLREQSGAEMILFVTPIIKSGSEIIAFALETVNFASPIINSVLEIIFSEPDTIKKNIAKPPKPAQTGWSDQHAFDFAELTTPALSRHPSSARRGIRLKASYKGIAGAIHQAKWPSRRNNAHRVLERSEAALLSRS